MLINIQDVEEFKFLVNLTLEAKKKHKNSTAWWLIYHAQFDGKSETTNDELIS